MDKGIIELSLHVPAQPLRLDIDPEFDIFRRLDREEMPPALSQALGAKKMLILLPASANSTLLQAYREFAGSLVQCRARYRGNKARYRGDKASVGLRCYTSGLGEPLPQRSNGFSFRIWSYSQPEIGAYRKERNTEGKEFDRAHFKKPEKQGYGAHT